MKPTFFNEEDGELPGMVDTKTESKPDTKTESKAKAKKTAKFSFQVTARHSPVPKKTLKIEADSGQEAFERFCELNKAKASEVSTRNPKNPLARDVEKWVAGNPTEVEIVKLSK